jgi:hypothetical protein
MSLHTAVLVTAQQCGHCRNMRGSGRLLSQNEIKKENKPANIPGGFHFDAKFMRRILTGQETPNASNKQVVRLINIHYKSMNPTDGISDISIFLVENPTTIRQIIMKEQDGKTSVEVYLIGENGKQLSKDVSPTVWADTVRLHVPINLMSYVAMFPLLTIFHSEAWAYSIQNSKPIYGFINGLESKTTSPYGFIQSKSPKVLDFAQFIGNFFNGTQKLESQPSATVIEKTNDIVPSEIKAPEAPKSVKFEDTEAKGASGSIMNKPIQSTSCSKIKYRLYVKE